MTMYRHAIQKIFQSNSDTSRRKMPNELNQSYKVWNPSKLPITKQNVLTKSKLLINAVSLLKLQKE